VNWFISDTHFRHANIIKYCNRPFQTLEEMDVTIVNNINVLVGEDDTLWHLGDFAFGRDATELAIELMRRQIRCKNVNLITGSHDRTIVKSKKLSSLFASTLNYYLGLIDGVEFLLIHRPVDLAYLSWERTLIEKEVKRNPALIWLHGHTHNNSHIGPRNLCVEVTGYKPVSIEEIKERFINVSPTSYC